MSKVDLKEDLDGLQEDRIMKMRNFYSIDEKPSLAPYDFNNPDFDIKAYMDRIFGQNHFEALVRKNKLQKKEIRELDYQLQRIVYENYSKFIKSSKTIQQMRTDISDVSSEMKNLNEKFMQVVKSSKVINSHVSKKREEIKKLYNISDMLEKLHFVLELPQRLKKCKDKKYYSLCVKYYKITEHVLNKYSHLFKQVYENSKSIMEEIKTDLMKSMFGNEKGKKKSGYRKFGEYLNILIDLQVPKDELKTKLIDLINNRIEKIIEAFNQQDVSKEQNDSMCLRVQNLHGLFDHHLSNFIDNYKIICDKEKEKIVSNQKRFDKIIRHWFLQFFECIRKIISDQYKAENEKSEEDLKNTFQEIITQFKTYYVEFEYNKEGEIKGEQMRMFLQDKFMRVFSFILKDTLLQKNLYYFQKKLHKRMSKICGLTMDSFSDEKNVRSESDSEGAQNMAQDKIKNVKSNSIKEESLNFSNFLIQIIEKYTKKYKKFLKIFEKELVPNKKNKINSLFSVSETLGLEFLDSWIEINCTFIVEYLLKKILSFTIAYSQTQFLENENDLLVCTPIGALVYYKFCHLANEKSLSTIYDIIRDRKCSKKTTQSDTVLFDVEKLSFSMYDVSHHCIVYYVEKQGIYLNKFVKVGIKLPNWKNEPQPRRVSHWCVGIIEELNQIWDHLSDALGQEESDDTDSTFSTKTGSTLRYYSTLKYGRIDKQKNADESLGGLILDGKFKVRLSNRTFDIFTISVRDVRVKNIFNEINKIWLKELDELIRHINLICLNGLWKLQIDCVYLSKKLFKNTNDEITQLFNEVLRSANNRCLNAKNIGKLVLEKIVNENL